MAGWKGWRVGQEDGEAWRGMGKDCKMKLPKLIGGVFGEGEDMFAGIGVKHSRKLCNALITVNRTLSSYMYLDCTCVYMHTLPFKVINNC